MSGFKRICISLFLVLLNLTAVSGHMSPSPVREGAEVTLSCDNVKEDRSECDSVSWLVTYNNIEEEEETELVRFGQINTYQLSRSKDRLSLTEKCSVVIKKVSAEDVGRYVCRQFESGRQQAPDSVVDLSVVTMTEQKDGDEVKLSCFVFTYTQCEYLVTLALREDYKQRTTSPSLCWATASFPTSHLIYTPKKYELFQCELTEYWTGKVQQFTFRPQSSGRGPELLISEQTNSTTTQEAAADCSALTFIMLLMRVAELLLITVITVLLVRARGNQRAPECNTVSDSVRSRTVTRSGAAASQVQDDGGVHDATVNYENVTPDPSAPVRFNRIDI
ncbi:uncharacterized protein LOC130187424 isoform X2 [Seriola aureovittata]|uniref:uncharacterized protein LOC130187424 isoform X2 n=1 Tax=Seriola aureovittata TaxID=2871759 RepID=UPI0024BE3BF1|nr:uncharacterized protein LOC130187424 isoform X2 [Seriola aureovittata]